MTPKQQYQLAYRFNRQYQAAAAGKCDKRQRAIAQAFIALNALYGIPGRIHSAAADSYLNRREPRIHRLAFRRMLRRLELHRG